MNVLRVIGPLALPPSEAAASRVYELSGGSCAFHACAMRAAAMFLAAAEPAAVSVRRRQLVPELRSYCSSSAVAEMCVAHVDMLCMYVCHVR